MSVERFTKNRPCCPSFGRQADVARGTSTFCIWAPCFPCEFCTWPRFTAPKRLSCVHVPRQLAAQMEGGRVYFCKSFRRYNIYINIKKIKNEKKSFITLYYIVLIFPLKYMVIDLLPMVKVLLIFAINMHVCFHSTGGETIFTPGWEPPLVPVFQPGVRIRD
jgi:hypothetical protein